MTPARRLAVLLLPSLLACSSPQDKGASSNASAPAPAAGDGASSGTTSGGDAAESEGDAGSPTTARPSCGAAPAGAVVVLDERFTDVTLLGSTVSNDVETWLPGGTSFPKIAGAGADRWVSVDTPASDGESSQLVYRFAANGPAFAKTSTLTVDLLVTLLAGEEPGEKGSKTGLFHVYFNDSGSALGVHLDEAGTPTAEYQAGGVGQNWRESIGLAKLGTTTRCVRLSASPAARTFEVFVDGQLARKATLEDDIAFEAGKTGLAWISLGALHKGSRPRTTARYDDLVVRVRP